FSPVGRAMSTAKTLKQARTWIANNPFGRKLSRRLLIWFAIFSLVPLIATNTVGYVQSQRIIERLVYRYLHALAQVEARHVRDQIERQQMALSIIATGNEFLAAGAIEMAGGTAGQMGQIATHDAVQQYLSRKLTELRAFDALRIYSLDGRVLVTVLRAGAVRPDVAGASQDGFFVIPPRMAYEPPRFHVVVPLQRNGNTVGYMGAIIGSQQLQAFLEIPEHLAGSVHSIIVDELGRPLFVSDPMATVDYMRPHPISIQPGQQDAHARYRDRAGRTVIASSAIVAGTPWTFVTEMPESDALGALQALRRTSGVLELIFVLLLGVIAWFVARTIVTPVRHLVAAARRVAAGDLDARVDAREADELGELGRTFNDMTTALAEASASVQLLHQQQIERAQQLATVGELAAGVAHEIKNPVVGISNGLDLVQRRIGTDPVVTPIMTEMLRQIARIDAAVKDLLAFARPTTPTFAPVEGSHVIERAMRLVQPAAANAGIKVEVRCEPDLPRVLLDEELITQALVNVLMNAVQATPSGGKIIVRARATDETLEFSVSDTGRGITPEDLEHIYKPFFTTRHSGTGLGLSITRDTIERHGGRIQAQSKVGRGTTFTITLPLAHVTEPELVESEVAV
ncbi:MAG TPA: ATP-binding protein, partial [Longimicrobiales bacterium]